MAGVEITPVIFFVKFARVKKFYEKKVLILRLNRLNFILTDFRAPY